MSKKIDEILKNAKGKAGEMKAAKDDFKKLPAPWSAYEMNSNKVLRSIATKNIQKIPTGKKAYYLATDQKNRRAISEAELFALLSFKKESVKKTATAKSENKKIEHGLSKEEVNALMDKNFVKKILQEGGAKHLICYKLDQEGCTTKEIMAITNSPYQSTKRNIWLYTSGKLKV